MKKLIALILLMAVTGWGLPQGDLEVSGDVKITANMSVKDSSDSEIVTVDETNKRVGIGDDSPDYDLSVKTDGGIDGADCAIRINAVSLADGNKSNVTCEGTANSTTRYAQLAVLKHSGITNPCGLILIYTQDNVGDYIWPDDSDVLRISSTSSNVGTTGGTVIGSQTSDIRLKTDIKPLTYGLKEIIALETISFEYRDGGARSIGFSAQQTKPIIPEAVYDTKEKIDDSGKTRLAMYYVNIIPVLVNAIKEQQAQIEQLKLDISKLKQ